MLDLFRRAFSAPVPPAEPSEAEDEDASSSTDMHAAVVAKSPRVIDVADRRGSTGYVDYISIDEMADAALVTGVDDAKRPFFAIRGFLYLRKRETKTIFRAEPFMQTFFQRYTDGSLWMGCGHASRRHLLATDGGMSDYQRRLVRKLIEEGEVEVGDLGMARFHCLVWSLRDFDYKSSCATVVLSSEATRDLLEH